MCNLGEKCYFSGETPSGLITYNMDQLLCKKCKTGIAAEGHRCCDRCLEKQRQYMRTRRAELAKRNLCEGCRINSRREGGIYCVDCLESQRQGRDAWKKDGLCILCGLAVVPGKARCGKCLSIARKNDVKQSQKRRKSGTCVKCGVGIPVHPHIRCHVCLSSKAKAALRLNHERRKGGICVRCCEKAIDGNCFCEVCYFKHIAFKRTGSSSNWEFLKGLFSNQAAKCPYTGIELLIGVNAELDHRIPKSKNGTDEISNLQWVYAPVNTMKWDMNESDFLAVVFKISQYFAEKIAS